MVEYIKEEKLWRSPKSKIQKSALGPAILDALQDDDPKRIIEIHYDSGTQHTVETIRRQMITIAQNLKRLGIKKGDTIVLYSMSNEKVTPITFACYAIGAPVNFFEVAFNEDEAIKGLKILDPTVIIYEEVYKDKLFKAMQTLQLSKLKYIFSMGSGALSVDHTLFDSNVDITSFKPAIIEDPDNFPAAYVFTSGSTGFPKLIIHSHTFMKFGTASWWHLEPGNITFCFSPLRWISQTSFMLKEVFLKVQRIYTSQPPGGLLGRDIIDSYGVTHFFTMPQIYMSVLENAEKKSASLTSLKIALISGEYVPKDLVQMSQRIAPWTKFATAFGMSELAGCLVCTESIQKTYVNGGAFIAGVTVKIVDEDYKSLGPGEKGELCVKMWAPFMGYFKDEKANKESFIDGEWLKTGDYCFIDSDNLLHVLTRCKFILRSKGLKLIPNGVEDIIKSHPNVLKAVLVGVPNPNEPGNEIGTVFVILKDDKNEDNIGEELKQLIAGKLPEEELRIVQQFRVVSEYPLTSCGKVDRMALKAIVKNL